MENQPLSEAVGALEHSLNAPIMSREYAWAERMGWALANVERNLFRVDAPWGQMSRSDKHRPALPTRNWRPDKVELSLRQQCKELRRAVQDLAQPFTTPTELDLNPMIEEGRKLLNALRQHLETKVNFSPKDRREAD